MGMGHIETKATRVAVGLSGGVDSSVAAALLMEKGFDVIGVSMRIFDGSLPMQRSKKHTCYGPDEDRNIDSAASICKKLGIPFHVIDLKREFKNHVIEYFRNEYLDGRTPNPCIVCNHRIKFGLLPEKAKKAGIVFDLFATGHYARISEFGGRFLLKKPADLLKDQTYFLYALRPDQLSNILFPLSEYRKKEVRDIAISMGLRTRDRPESQDFISGNDYSLLFSDKEIKHGDIVDENGNVLGRHRGIIHYTIGQRKGLGLSSPRPLYISGIDAGKNRITVSGKESLFSKGLISRDLNLIAIDELDRPYRVKVKIRLQHKETDAELLPYRNNRGKIIFDEPQMSVTPGQAAVFYLDDTVLGGGIIEKALS
jgi:tRNA-specific 2-thiouridylase